MQDLTASKCAKFCCLGYDLLEGYELCDNDEKRRNYVNECMQKRRTDAKSIKKTKSTKQKRKADNPEYRKEISKRSSRRLRQKQRQSNPEMLKEYEKKVYEKNS